MIARVVRRLRAAPADLADPDGQALLIAVLGIGIAAATVVGLLDAQERLLAAAHARRSGEAAVEAAGAALADAQVALLVRLRDDHGRPRSLASRAEIAALAADPIVADAARGAAQELATLNRSEGPTDLRIDAVGKDLEVTLTLGGRRHRVAIGAACCRP